MIHLRYQLNCHKRISSYDFELLKLPDNPLLVVLCLFERNYLEVEAFTLKEKTSGTRAQAHLPICIMHGKEYEIKGDLNNIPLENKMKLFPGRVSS